MIKRSVATRYAKVLFGLEKDQLEKRLEEIESFYCLLKNNPELLKFLKAPQIRLDEKKKALKAIVNDSYGKAFMHFIFYLIEKRKLDLLSSIAFEFHLMVNEQLKIWETDVRTAVPISPDVENKLKEKLEHSYQKKVKIHNTIDSKMIGGAILVMGNEMIDWSVKGRLKKLKENLLGSSG